MYPFKKALIVTVLISSNLFLFGCGSSSDATEDEDVITYEDSYIQFYNAVPNSKSTAVTLIDSDETESYLGQVSYSRATGLNTIPANNEYVLSLSYLDDFGKEEVFNEQAIELKEGQKMVAIFTGSYDNPDIVSVVYDRYDLEDEFRLYFTNVTSKTAQLEILIADAGDTIDEASLIGDFNFGGVIESDKFDLAEYHFFIRNLDTGEVIFDSENITFNFSTQYLIVLKDAFGPSQSKIAMDVIGNTSSVFEFDDLDSLAQFRAYNTIENLTSIDLSIDGSTPLTIEGLTPLNMTEFQTVEFGDYQLNVTSQDSEIVVDDSLLTLNQNESKTVIIYQDQNQIISALDFTQYIIPSSYQHNVDIVNLIEDYEDLDVYFVKSDETIDTATEYAVGIDFTERYTRTLNSNLYTILLVHENDNEQRKLLARLDDVALGTTSGLVLIADDADPSIGGYKLTLVE
ncbi:hypothetical protein L0668_06345 [Paraglaciecola aquimarina]|uniref:DUF4397 domain-containing protein n=1 Tax=Paraglaciecola algarum TaxID=3050085 RepID=A0ABS9D5K9_9ALTE|nr:hypothetical protein [Paraglaciecola sp. G1-23]MCF2947717.1 hypothetical protein [Paraglaciecola sp. G1-23]